MTICPEFDGDRCWVCVDCMDDLAKTFIVALPVAFAGTIGTILATAYYPPIESNSLVVYSIPTPFLKRDA